jgi:hypothetical protein
VKGEVLEKAKKIEEKVKSIPPDGGAGDPDTKEEDKNDQ